MWLSASGILVLLLYVNPTISKDTCSDGMIKDAILSLARIIRDNSQKVERHGAREHRLNENLKKAVDDLTKKMSGVDTYVTHFSRIEDRISEIEQLISQRDERERIQMQKTADSIGSLEARLEARLVEIKNTMSEISHHITTAPNQTTTSVSPEDIISRINDTEAHLLKKVSQVDSSLQTLAIKQKEDAATLTEKREEKERIRNQKTEKFIENSENRLKTQLDEINRRVGFIVKATPPTPTTECASASNIVSILNDTGTHFLEKIEEIESSLSTLANNNAREATTQVEKLLTILNERGVTDSIQNQKTEKLIENSESHLETLLEEIKSKIEVIVGTTPPSPTIECASTSDIVSMLNGTEANFLKKVEQLESSLDTLSTKNAHEVATLAEKLQAVFNEEILKENTENQETKKIIQDLEIRLQTGLDDIKTTIEVISETTQPTPTIDCASASDISSMLNDTELHILEKVEQVESSLDSMAIKNAHKTATHVEKLLTILDKKNLTDSIQNQKTEKLIENSENRLKTWLEEIKNTVKVIVETTPPTPTIECASVSDMASILNDTEANLLEKAVQIESSLVIMTAENNAKAAIYTEKLQAAVTEVQHMSNNIGSSLEKVHEACEKEAEKSEERIADLGAIFEEQTRALGNVTDFIENILNRIQDIPTTSEIQALHNETQAALQEAKHTLQSAVSDKINGMISNIGENNKEVSYRIENVRSDLATNIAIVNKELHNLVNGQALMMTTAQEVLETKRAVEFGNLQILSWLHESLKNHAAAINETLNQKFDGVSNDIMDSHGKALANLTTKMEEELKLVWRQIMIMTQMTAKNAETLTKLNEQNEAYVNGTTLTMDGMESQVSDIMKRVIEVGGNLSYLLGRLNLITQEFNQIKTGLGAVLDDIKSSFKEIDEKANGLSHPGPHRVPNDYRGDEQSPNMYTTPNNVIVAA